MVVKFVLIGFYHRYLIERDDLNGVREVESERGEGGESRERRKDIDRATDIQTERKMKRKVLRGRGADIELQAYRLGKKGREREMET